MQRNRHNTDDSLNPRSLHVLSEVIGRAMLASRLGLQSYAGERDLYKALGYKEKLDFDDYYSRYLRQDIAKAVINRPVKATWQGIIELLESGKKEETEFEKAWRQLNRKFGLKSRFSRLDRLTGIGRYGVLVLGLDDVNGTESWKNPVRSGERKLLYVRPLSEASAEISEFQEETSDERFGMPLFYKVKAMDPQTKRDKVIQIHYTRVIHVTDDPLESEVYGTPRLEAIFNRLMDVEKIAGGDAEMFWRGARPGYYGKLDPDYQATQTFKDDLMNQIKEFEHNITRFLINEGVDLKALEQQIADPSPHMDTQLKLISSDTGIPLRILTGSERGELASSEDRSEWLSYVQTRREEHAEPCILRPVVDRFVELGILPKPADDYSVEWSELFAQSEKMRVEIGKGRANALREYTTNPLAMEVIPPEVFLEKGLGFTVDEIEWAQSVRDADMKEEIKRMKEIQDVITPTAPSEEGTGREVSKEQKGTPKQKRTPPSASV